jgi:5-methylcytosine-specific restriction endonuclease McrBC regulatory subunit McrC
VTDARLRLTEYGEALPWPGTGAELEQLRAEAARWKRALGLAGPPLVIEYQGRDRYSVRAEAVTGFLQIGQLALEIRPKFLAAGDDRRWRRALWEVLSSVEERPRLGERTGAGREDVDSFPDLMGWILLESLRQGQALGVPRGYVEQSSSLEVLRGRLELHRIAETLVTPYLLPCVYDVYHEDVAVNRLFRWAASTLAALVRSPSLSRQLLDAAAALQAADGAPPGFVEAEHLALPATCTHLEPALHVARMLLRRESILHVGGEEHAASFLWNSSLIFERFMGYLLQRVCARTPGVRLEGGGRALATPAGGGPARTILTYPDARLCAGERTLLVLDAKYKALAAGGRPSHEDVYQVTVAGRISACDDVYLLYPGASGARQEPMRWTLRGAGQPRRLTAVFVDLLEMARPSGEQRLLDDLLADLQPSLPAPRPPALSSGPTARS